MKERKTIFVLGLIVLITTSMLITVNAINNQAREDETDIGSNQSIEQPSTNIITQIYFGFRIDILHAYYYDLDRDRLYDDVYTIISISSLSGFPEDIDAYIYQYITLPSGLTYYLRIHVYGYDSYFRISTRWYNVATEQGWYLFKASIENYNYYGYTFDTASVIFDPPTAAPEGAMPTASISIS